MRFLKWLFGAALFLAVVGFMLWDVNRSQIDTGTGTGIQEVLIMGTEAGFKPFEYKEGTKIVGFDVDLATEIAGDNGKVLKIEEMAFDGLLPALQSGRIDMVVAGMSITPERLENVDFSVSYYSAAQKVIVRKDSTIIQSISDLDGKTIGVQLGTTGDTLAHRINGARIVQLPQIASVMQELNSGRIDGAILDDAVARQYLTQNPDLTMLSERLTSEDYAIAVRKGSDELLEQINDSIIKMKQDGRYDNLIKKYFGS